MRRIDCIADLVAQFREEFRNEIISSETVAILRLEELFPNHPFRIDKEKSRTCHSEVLSNGFRVQYLIIPNDFRVRVSE